MQSSAEQLTPFPELNDVLRCYREGLAAALGSDLIGAYLGGSFAVGDADEFSDVDVIVITKNEISESQLARLQNLHGRIYELDSAWAQHLEISYFPCALLNEQESVGVTKLWYLDNGQRSLKLDTHDNTWVVRWVLRECGIAMTGPTTKGLVDPIPRELMRAELIGIVKSWGCELIADPDLMKARWYQAFVVVTWCRILMTLETGRVHSKLVSARWAQTNLDKRWTGLIEHALGERRLPWDVKVKQEADPKTLEATDAFTRFVLARIEER